MTPDHRGITTAYPSSISNRASSIDSDLSVYASSKQQDLDACSTVSSTDVSSSFDFDLDLLPVIADCQVPSLELPFPELENSKDNKNSSCDSFCAEEDFIGSCCGLSQQVPSPSNTLSPISHAHSPTMFSPGGGGAGGGMENNSCKAATAPTTTVSKYSPYAAAPSPAASVASSRTAGGRRLSSSASTASSSSSSVQPQFSLLESLAEFNALQNRIKVERESVAGAGAHSPPPPPSYAESTSAAKATVKMEAAGPSSSSSSMPPPPYSHYGGGFVIKSEMASSDAEMEEGEQSFNRMDPVLSLVMEQARKDIDFTCAALSISNGEFEFDNPFPPSSSFCNHH